MNANVYALVLTTTVIGCGPHIGGGRPSQVEEPQICMVTLSRCGVNSTLTTAGMLAGLHDAGMSGHQLRVIELNGDASGVDMDVRGCGVAVIDSPAPLVMHLARPFLDAGTPVLSLAGRTAASLPESPRMLHARPPEHGLAETAARYSRERGWARVVIVSESAISPVQSVFRDILGEGSDVRVMQPGSLSHSDLASADVVVLGVVLGLSLRVGKVFANQRAAEIPVMWLSAEDEIATPALRDVYHVRLFDADDPDSLPFIDEYADSYFVFPSGTAALAHDVGLALGRTWGMRKSVDEWVNSLRDEFADPTADGWAVSRVRHPVVHRLGSTSVFLGRF